MYIRYKDQMSISNRSGMFLISDYVDELMEEVCQACSDGDLDDKPQPLDVPPPLAAAYERPDKAEAVRNFVSRFTPRV